MTEAERNRISMLRQRVLSGTITPDEEREAIRLLRADRAAAVAASAKPAQGSRAKKAPVNSDDLLAELDGL